MYSTPRLNGSAASEPSILTSRRKIDQTLGPFYARRRVPLGKVVASGVGGPFWALVPLLLAWPALAFVRGPIRRWRRRRRGCCTSCGYPLAGLPGPRCPECGKAASPGATKTAAN